MSLEALLFVEEAAIEEELLAKARHDIRNRLAVIRGSAFYLRRRMEATDLWGSDPRVQQFFAQMEAEVDIATTLLSEKLTISRPLTRKVLPTDVADCVRAAIERSRALEERGVRVEVSVASAVVRAEPAELCLAVRCLIENAAEATPRGGVTIVSVEIVGPAVVIDVRDQGEGFGEGGVDQALEPFYTTRSQHRGLGLNIAQRICKRYGGRLDLRELSPGASARLSLPLAVDEL